MITVNQLCKDYHTFDRAEGVLGAIKNLFVREYKNVRAVDSLNFEIPKGQIVGLIGPNGAGKSTTIKMLTGILAPSSGKIEVAGFNPYTQRVNYVKNIGVVFGQRSQLWWDIAVIESLKLLKKIYDVSDQDFNQRLDLFKQVLDLNPHLHKPVRKLSLGERMRCDLAASLIHNPPVLFLDEPTIGLDVVAKEEARSFLRKINQEYQTTVILTTHDLNDIEELSSRIIIIDHGKKIFDDSIDQLKMQLGAEVQILATMSHAYPKDQNLDLDARIKVKSFNGQKLEIGFKASEISSAESLRLIFDRFSVREIKIAEPDIEDIIRRVYQGETQASAA